MRIKILGCPAISYGLIKMSYVQYHFKNLRMTKNQQFKNILETLDRLKV